MIAIFPGVYDAGNALGGGGATYNAALSISVNVGVVTSAAIGAIPPANHAAIYAIYSDATANAAICAIFPAAAAPAPAAEPRYYRK